MLDDLAPFVPLVMKKRGKEIDYEAKTVMLAGRRYIVCRNRQGAKKDAADRASIVAALGPPARRRATRHWSAAPCPSALSQRRSSERTAIDPDKIEAERKVRQHFRAAYTGTGLNHTGGYALLQAAVGRWSRPFEPPAHPLSTRPIFHKLDETIRGPRVLQLPRARAEVGAGGAHYPSRSGSWAGDHPPDLGMLTETEIAYDGKRFPSVRSAPRPAASLALQTAKASRAADRPQRRSLLIGPNEM